MDVKAAGEDELLKAEGAVLDEDFAAVDCLEADRF